MFDQIRGDPRTKIENAVIEHIQAQDNEHADELFEKIPEFCRVRFRLQLRKFVDSALNAILTNKRNSNYVVNGRQIKPVDRDNTGIIQHNTVYSNGLHQFLEIKHKLSVRSLGTTLVSKSLGLTFSFR